MKQNAAGQKITPFLWFDKEAGEAAKLYASLFKDSKITDVTTLRGTPSGTVEIVAAEFFGQGFSLFSAGPLFKFTPAVSFLIACGTKEEVDILWKTLSEKGKTMMELGEYPFSGRYGWVQDRYGVSWQVMFMGNRAFKQRITPTLMFTGGNWGKAEEAIRFYASVFKKAAIGEILRYGKDEAPDQETSVKHASFTLEGQGFAAMDSARVHGVAFNEAISFTVTCKTQKEIDHYWQKLSADPAAEQCGWLKDKYGVSWQIVPSMLNGMLKDKDPKKAARVTEAFLKMKKFNIAALKRAYQGGKGKGV